MFSARVAKNRLSYLFLTGLLILLPLQPVQADDYSPVINLFFADKLTYDDWYEVDRTRAQSVVTKNLADRDYLQSRMMREWQQISRELEKALSERYVDARHHFILYPAGTSGKIHTLGLAKYYREKVLEGLMEGKVSCIAYPQLLSGQEPVGIPGMGDNGLVRMNGDNSYSMEEVLMVLNQQDLPEAVLAGVTFYMLPYSLVDYAAFAYSQGLPGREEAIYLSAGKGGEGQPPLATALTHELGHVLHYQFMGEYEANPQAWLPFMELIGQEKYEADYYRYWSMTDENFAEYFRIVYGSPAARNGFSYQGLYKNPTGIKELQHQYCQLIKDITGIKAGFFNMDTMHISFRGPGGISSRLPVGPRPEQINTIVTTGPRLVFTGGVSEGGKRDFVPAAACYQVGQLSNNIDYTVMPIVNGQVKYEIDLPREGIYNLQVGAAGTGILHPIDFRIIYLQSD